MVGVRGDTAATGRQSMGKAADSEANRLPTLWSRKGTVSKKFRLRCLRMLILGALCKGQPSDTQVIPTVPRCIRARPTRGCPIGVYPATTRGMKQFDRSNRVGIRQIGQFRRRV